MYYAPIMIPTLCRSEHFIRCIESLKKNSWAKYTDVYIALDYPSKESHRDGYKKICKYLEGEFKEFRQFNVIKRPYNYGSVKNSRDLRNKLLMKYDRFIRTDDDCEFSENFLEFMDKCLEKYEDDESVLGVTGYSYPIKWDISPECNAFKNMIVFPVWGTGFWKRSFKELEDNLMNGFINEFVQKNGLHRKQMTDARYLECLCEAYGYDKGSLLNNVSDVACGCYLQLKNKYIISPKKSMVRNYGFDGSGVYCQNTKNNSEDINNATEYNYIYQSIDENNTINLKVDESSNFTKNRKLMNAFDNRGNKVILKAQIKYLIKKIIFKLLGKDKYLKVKKRRSGR